MGRQLTLPAFIATLVATWYGGIFGVTALAYEKGIYNFITQGIFWYLTYILFAFWLAPKVHKSQALTLPDLIGKSFGPKSGKISAVFNLFNVVPITYTLSIGVLIQTFTGLELTLSMGIGVFFVCFYSSWGGFRSVVISDIFQFFLMIFSVISVLIFSIYKFGLGSYLSNNLSPKHLNPTGGEGLASLLIWGFIALSTLVDPNFYQRCFAAKTPKIARRGILFSTVIWFFFDICTTLGGLYAFSWNPSLDPNEAYLKYALHILPPVFKGLFLAGITATILSTLDSYLFLSSTTLTHDLLKIKNFKFWHHPLGVFLTGFISIVLANFSDGSIASIWKTLGSLSAASLMLPVLSHYIWPSKFGDMDFVSASLSSAIVILGSKLMGIQSIDPFYLGVFTCASVLGLSALIKQRDKKLSKNS